MTFAAMGCGAAETARRQAVCARLNVLCHKRDTTEDKAKAKRIDRSIKVLLRQERPWMRDAAYWLY